MGDRSVRTPLLLKLYCYSVSVTDVNPRLNEHTFDRLAPCSREVRRRLRAHFRRRGMERRTLRPRTVTPPSPATEAASPSAKLRSPLPRPAGRILVVHANGKEYGRGAAGNKASNREFAFAASDYVAMRDSGQPYSGNPRRNWPGRKTRF